MRDVLTELGEFEVPSAIHCNSTEGNVATVATSTSADSYQSVFNLLRAALMECAPPAVAKAVVVHRRFKQACVAAHEDLDAFLSKDPAQRGSAAITLTGSTSYKAILHYRLAHALIEIGKLEDFAFDELEAYACLVSNRGKLLSGAEIHPRSEIGRRFVLDHGWGSVIGETSVIGHDCYLLGGVTLGAAGIANNPSARRHPTLGDRVQIGAFARVFGNIQIGNDVFIGTHCCVTQDIASDSIVTLRSQTQIVRGDNTAKRV
ncbi:serine O-acetyltransferase [Paraburkholderia phytofirmans]|uniref:serine O-acetyltransferase n=1 Tax=Paraburkholderia phytofirmans TaxID=261302 RepID=UPI0038BD9431